MRAAAVWPWDLKILLSFGAWNMSALPPSQSEGVADDDQIGQTHRQRAHDRAEKTERRERERSGVVEEGPEEVLFDCAQRGLRQSERFGDCLNVRLQQDNIGRLAGNVAGLSDGNTEVSLLQRRRVVDAVADEGDAFAALLEQLHHLRFLFGTDFCKHVFFRNAGLLRNRRGGVCVVTGDEIDGSPALFKSNNDLAGVGFEGVAQRKHADELTAGRETEDSRPPGRPCLQKFLTKRRINAGLAQPSEGAESEEFSVQRSLNAFAADLLSVLQLRIVAVGCWCRGPERAYADCRHRLAEGML